MPLLTGTNAQWRRTCASNRYRLRSSAVVFSGRRGPSLGHCMLVSKKGRTTCVGPHGPSGPPFWRPSRSALLPAAAATAASNRQQGQTNTGTKRHEKPKTGGKLTVLWTDDVDHIDCGQTYYQMGNFVCYATQRPLYAYKPDDGTTLVPGPRRRRPAGLRGRQDRHGQDQRGREVLAAVRTATSRPRTSSTRSSAASSTPSPTATPALLRRPRGRQDRRQAGHEIDGIETPDDRRSS